MRDPLYFSRPGLQQHAGAFPVLENTIKDNKKTITNASQRGFSMIELVVVVSIVGIIAAIAVPKFADAGAGRRLSAAKRALISDIHATQLRARATSKTHVVMFYPDSNKYIIFESTEVKRETIVLNRDLDNDPYNLSINSTNIPGNQYAIITPFGDLSPAFTVDLTEHNTTIQVSFEGVGDPGIVPVITFIEQDAIDNETELDAQFGAAMQMGVQ